MKKLASAAAAAVALCVTALALPAAASSTTASSASDSAASSAGGSSDSVKSSGEGSSRATRAVAGDYRIIEVTAAADRPGTLRLKLQPVVADGQAEGIFLYLPQQIFEQHRLAAGQWVSARERGYGVAFARQDAQQPFFLVLDDTWHRELPAHAVVL